MANPPLQADSSDPTIPAVQGEQTGEDGTGVLGIGPGNGVFGQSKGTQGFSGVHGDSDGGPGVSGTSRGSVGVDARTETGPAALRAIHAEGKVAGHFGGKVEIFAQDGLAVTGFQPFVTLQDTNAGNASAHLQCADGDLLLNPNNASGLVIAADTGNVGIGAGANSALFESKLNVVTANNSGIFVQSTNHAAIVAHGAGAGAVLFLEQHGVGDLIQGGVQNRDVSFRVLNNCDVQVRQVTLTCDQNIKANFSDVDRGDILERLAAMPIRGWNYKMDPGGVQHIGPTSQDFRAAFGLNGDDDTHISVVDSQGIAFAAIQGLNEKLTAENEYLKAKLASLETRLAALESNSRDAVAI
jgi:hypothetical protein